MAGITGENTVRMRVMNMFMVWMNCPLFHRWSVTESDQTCDNDGIG